MARGGQGKGRSVTVQSTRSPVRIDPGATWAVGFGGSGRESGSRSEVKRVHDPGYRRSAACDCVLFPHGKPNRPSRDPRTPQQAETDRAVDRRGVAPCWDSRSRRERRHKSTRVHRSGWCRLAHRRIATRHQYLKACYTSRGQMAVRYSVNRAADRSRWVDTLALVDWLCISSR